MGSRPNHDSSRWMVFLASALFFCASVVHARPQSESNQSVAEAARKAKEQKKKSAKPVKTFTEDDIAALRAAAAAKGELAPEPGTSPEQPGGKAKEGANGGAAAAPNQEEVAKQEAELKKLKEELADAEKDSNLLQRDFALQSEQFYSKPDFNRDTDGKAKLDDLQKQIGAKQQDVDRLKMRVAALQELLDRAKAAGGETPPPPAKPTAPAQPAPPAAPPPPPGLN